MLESAEDAVHPLGVDVVAVPGLAGNVQQSWTHPDGTFWLRDLLPQSINGIRVYCYAYSLDIFLDPSLDRLRNEGNAFLAALDQRAPPQVRS